MNRPGKGFLVCCLSYVLCFGYFYWASTEPTLNRLWRVENALKAGQLPNPNDLETLWPTLSKHPEYLNVFLNGKKAQVLGGTQPKTQVVVFRQAGDLMLKPNRMPSQVKIQRFDGHSKGGFSTLQWVGNELQLPKAKGAELLLIQTIEPIEWRVNL